MSDILSVTEPCTQYLVVYVSGAVVTDVHDAINRSQNDVETVVAIHLITPDGQTLPVDINDVSGTGDGTEFEIVGGDQDELREYVHYTAPDRGEFDEHETHETPLFQPIA